MLNKSDFEVESKPKLGVGTIIFRGDFDELVEHIKGSFTRSGFEISYPKDLQMIVRKPNSLKNLVGVTGGIKITLYKYFDKTVIDYSIQNTGILPALLVVLTSVYTPICFVLIYKDPELENAIRSSAPLILGAGIVFLLRFMNANKLYNLLMTTLMIKG